MAGRQGIDWTTPRLHSQDSSAAAAEEARRGQGAGHPGGQAGTDRLPPAAQGRGVRRGTLLGQPEAGGGTTLRASVRPMSPCRAATGGSLPPPGPPLAIFSVAGGGPRWAFRWPDTAHFSQGRGRDSGCTPRSDMAQSDAAGVNGGNRILSHGAPPGRVMPNGCLGSPVFVLPRP
jgi:hypothetical protein